MAWKQFEATPPHITYLILSTFLIIYALFSSFIRNKLHLSEPPLATLVGMVFGPRGVGLLTPEKWGLGEDVVQEFTRIVISIQCFAVGLELPKQYMKPHSKSVLYLLGPVMITGWLVVAILLYILFETDVPTSLVISACLTPTDPVLAASVLSNSQFSTRVPSRLRNLLSVESGCNDGVSFPFIYLGLGLLTRSTFASTFKDWFFVTILWQCLLGTLLGIGLGYLAKHLLQYCDSRDYVGRESYLVFYLLLAMFSTGISSILGVDDFLLAFSAGATFSSDGTFAEATSDSNLANVIDLLLNSTFFVYFGAIIPWSSFTLSWPDTPVTVTPWKLFAFLLLVLLFRRIPIVLALKKVIPDLKTWSEALFIGHFGPMGAGALFLAMEARTTLEDDRSERNARPPPPGTPPTSSQVCMEMVWPVICFVVIGSVMVHGLSILVVSVGIHFKKEEGERAPLIGGETEGIPGMVHSDDEEEG